MVREPAQAAPAKVAERIGKLRILVVPYLICLDSGDAISFSKPKGETHSAVWVANEDRTNLVLASRELDSHDTGFEFLASISEILLPRLSKEELDHYTRMLDEELRSGAGGEIDAEALAAKKALGAPQRWRRNRTQFERYRDVSFTSTLAEYMHGLGHDVQIRVGPDHLPIAQLRRRMGLLAEVFPPNSGYRVFAEELGRSEQPGTEK